METKLARKIVINGKEYATREEMPAELRALYDKAMEAFADRDGNQVPDFLEGKGPGVWQSAKQIWGVAREAQRLGVNNVTFTGEGPTEATAENEGIEAEAPDAPPAPQAPTFSLPPTSTGALEPTVTAGGGFRSLVILILLIAGALFLGSQLGLF